MVKKYFYSLLEAANNTSIRPEEFIHLAAQGEVAISVWFKGVVVTVDQRTYHFKVVGYRDELMCLTPYEASKFLIRDTSFVTHLVDECHFEKYRQEKFQLLENQSPLRPPEPIADELFVQAGNMGDFIPATAGAIKIYDLDQDKFPVYAVDNLVISWKEMERLKGLYPPNHPPVTQDTPAPTAENNQENHSSPVQQHSKGEKVYGWKGTKGIEVKAGMSRVTIIKANRKVKMPNIIHKNGKNVWAYADEVETLRDKYHEYMDRK